MEIFDVEPPTPSMPKTARRANPRFRQPAFDIIVQGPTPPSKFKAQSSSLKRDLNCNELAEDDLRLFKRVRLVHKKGRSRQTNGPFHHKASGEKLIINPTQAQETEEKRAWDELRNFQSSMGHQHPDTLKCLLSLAMKPRNWGKLWTAEELLRNAITGAESVLIARYPEVLQQLLTGLLAILVDQKKVEAADELWNNSVEVFQVKIGQEFANALAKSFSSVYTFRSPGGAGEPHTDRFLGTLPIDFRHPYTATLTRAIAETPTIPQSADAVSQESQPGNNLQPQRPSPTHLAPLNGQGRQAIEVDAVGDNDEVGMMRYQMGGFMASIEASIESARNEEAQRNERIRRHPFPFVFSRPPPVAVRPDKKNPESGMAVYPISRSGTDPKTTNVQLDAWSCKPVRSLNLDSATRNARNTGPRLIPLCTEILECSHSTRIPLQEIFPRPIPGSKHTAKIVRTDVTRRRRDFLIASQIRLHLSARLSTTSRLKMFKAVVEK